MRYAIVTPGQGVAGLPYVLLETTNGVAGHFGDKNDADDFKRESNSSTFDDMLTGLSYYTVEIGEYEGDDKTRVDQLIRTLRNDPESVRRTGRLTTPSLTGEQEREIRRLFFERVPDAARRAKIVQLAAALAEDDPDERSAVLRAIYHYSLPEHAAQVERDHETFVGNAFTAPDES